MIDRLISAAKATLHYLGDAAHKRFVVSIFVMLVNHYVGHKLDADQVSYALDLALGGLCGAWSKTTPQVEGGAQ